jgi:hypothetical protein
MIGEPDSGLTWPYILLILLDCHVLRYAGRPAAGVSVSWRRTRGKGWRAAFEDEAGQNTERSATEVEAVEGTLHAAAAAVEDVGVDVARFVRLLRRTASVTARWTAVSCRWWRRRSPVSSST